MEGILIVLDYFAGLSKLFINYTNNLIVCIPSPKYSRDVLTLQEEN